MMGGVGYGQRNDLPGDEIIDQCLGHIGEIAELRFPDGQRHLVTQTVPILEPQDSSFRQRAVADTQHPLLLENLTKDDDDCVIGLNVNTNEICVMV